MKYTPGPWYVIETDGTDFTAISTKPKLPKGREIDLDTEVLGSSEWLRVKKEDLKLMSLAPELLQALYNVVGLYDTYTSVTPIIDELRSLLKKVEDL